MKERLEVNPEGGRYANIVEGDRVVLLEGRDKGKIGKVLSLDRQRQEVTVEGLNLVCRGPDQPKIENSKLILNHNRSTLRSQNGCRRGQTRTEQSGLWKSLFLLPP